jgi:hypothetical protein
MMVCQLGVVWSESSLLVEGLQDYQRPSKPPLPATMSWRWNEARELAAGQQANRSMDLPLAMARTFY